MRTTVKEAEDWKERRRRKQGLSCKEKRRRVEIAKKGEEGKKS